MRQFRVREDGRLLPDGMHYTVRVYVDDGTTTAARWTTGQRVRHRNDGGAGVILEVLGEELQVAFSSGPQYVHQDDVLPFERQAHELLRDGVLEDSEAAYLRLLATLLDHSYRYDAGSTLSNARLEPKLHQAFVARRVVAEKVAPRMILADEVGLGKTIEAGLIIKELRARQAVERVLVIVPASLTRQWQSELATKFNEPFEIIDGAAAKHFGRGGQNPFAKVQNVICSLPFASSPKRADEIGEAGWDLVVFDEAHRVRRTKAGGQARTTQAYRLAEELREHIHGLLLLSATPVQLHAYELYSLIDLIEPGLFPTYEAFERQRLKIPDLNAVMRGLDRWPALRTEDRANFTSVHGALLAELVDVRANQLDDPACRDAAKDGLVARHPLSAVMVRNRKSELGLNGTRIAHIVSVERSDDEREIYEDVSEYIRESYSAAAEAKNQAVGFLMVAYQKMLTSSSNVLRASFRRRIAKLEREARRLTLDKINREALNQAEDPEESSELVKQMDGAALDTTGLAAEIEVLRNLADRLDDVRDTKVARTIQLVDEVTGHGKRVVIFTQFIETQNFLAAALEHNGFSVASFNGTMAADEKEEAIRAFREKAQVLVSTEAGGEGRNLQFASVIINYDLPWNPMKVEQRIGRLDRIGQTRPVEIYNLVYEGTMEERIVTVLKDRIRIFEESVGSLDPILGQVEKDIERLMLEVQSKALEQEFNSYVEDLTQRVAEARLLEETMADFVLDRASFRSDQANQLLGVNMTAKPGDLERFVTRSLDHLGGSVSSHVDGGSVVSLSPRLASRLGMREQLNRGVFDPESAAYLDDLDFFAFGHPLIDRLVDATRSLQNSAVGARKSSEVPPGTWVELIWRVSASLVVTEGLLIRHLVGEDCVVRSSDMRSLPFADQPVRAEVPGWVPAAVRASETRFHEERLMHRKNFQVRFEEVRNDRILRAERLFNSQEARLRLSIKQNEEWLAEREHGASARDLKILPARRGRLVRDRERLTQLQTDRSMRREELAQQQLDVRGEIVSAALVIGARP